MEQAQEALSSYLFHIDGIRCHSCIGKLEKLKDMHPNIHYAHLYFGQSLLEARVDSKVSVDEVTALISKIGFTAKFLKNESEGFLLEKNENKRLLNKLAVAGFLTANIMLFTIPLYTGVEEGAYKTSFVFLSLFLFLPVLGYCSLDFYKNAFSALKTKTLSIDLPIAVALTTGFVLSCYNIFIKKYDFLYFDSTASFVFLILTSRYLLRRVQQHYVYVDNLYDQVNSAKYIRVETGVSFKAEDIQKGDQFYLRQGMVLPVDATLVNPYAEFDTSFVSGESLPRVFNSDMELGSGSIALSEGVVVKAINSFRTSQLYQLIQKVEEVKKTKGTFSQASDKASHYLIFTIFTVAILFFIYYLPINPLEGFQRSLALLIVACPCALALGTPLAYAMAVHRARGADILVKKQNIFDKLNKVKNIFFDKTGTLTYGQLELITDSGAEHANIILNLEKTSSHPVAFAFRKSWGREFKDLPVSGFKENIGIGVEGAIDGVFYQLKKSGNNSNKIIVDLYADNLKIVSYAFEDQIREMTYGSIEKLQDKRLYLLTGDTQMNALEVGSKLNIPKDRIFSDKTPSEKLKIIKNHKNSIMIGDGINDVLALQGADVGISTRGNVSLSLEQADVYFLNGGISSLPHLITIAKRLRKCLISNMTISFVYNSLAGILALLGFINPLAAAILMPISSLVLICNTLWIMK